MAPPRKRDPSIPAREALYREIPGEPALNEAITGAATVNEINLADVENGGAPGDGTSVLGRWVYITPKGGDVYMRRYNVDDGAPSSASMQKGALWPDGVREEFYIDANDGRLRLAVEGAAACTLVFEFSKRS